MLVFVVEEDLIEVSFGSGWWLRIRCLVALEGGIVQERCFGEFGSGSCFDWRNLVEYVETFLSQCIIAEFEWVQGFGCEMLGRLIEGVAPACTCILVPPTERAQPCHCLNYEFKCSSYARRTCQLHREHVHRDVKIETARPVLMSTMFRVMHV